MVDLDDIATPSAAPTDTGVHFSASALSAVQQLYFYSADDWEEFVREWVTSFGETYHTIKRIGGSGDKGADIAAFATQNGFDGPWDCYQCKHYNRPLRWTDVREEIVKIFRYAAAAEYTLPAHYYFVAPRGFGSSLDRLFSSPTKLKTKFLEDFATAASDVPEAERTAALTLAQQDSFTRFHAVPLSRVIDGHRTTPYHAFRFGMELPPRAGAGELPDTIEAHEAHYVGKLTAVYRERWPHLDADQVHRDERTGRHFRRQRVRFFEAEALKAYARDSVPTGTFERFQDAIYSGVIDEAEASHPSGWERLTRVLTVAGQLNLQSHALIAKASQDDLKGVCHQLANDDRLDWTEQ
ncbi:ABC-three component system protein [Rathayibacter sp. VKM Ac-2927]|uniref:ABC-three component system protein n=1 Tax=Rathayibacter sp. VKM Ac-2927 TaxID=2929478 RepID=UPI001FB34F82|nr:ABC-three component system protein [Rathayibacter sp. VKM Ac-2927]MCJ1688633.1 hypothetical protein [Rathayibacter sp. VKM Ac-2927]